MSTSPSTIDRSATVAQIVARHSETAAVFQRHRIDFCCRGDRTLAQACANLGRDPEALIAELERTVRERALEPPEEDLLGLSTPALLERIVERHHGYLRRALPCLEPLLAKVAAVHGEHNPKLLALGRAFTELAGMLGPHLEFEEQALFPELLRLPGPPEGVREDLDDMAREHFGVGTKLAQIRSLADDFTTPAWGCSSYRALMTELQELEADVLQHVHLENHVLMPRFAGREPALS